MKPLFLLCLIFFGAFPLFAQTTYCPDDPPLNPFLADSPWPIYHRNNYAQASTCLTGPQPGDSLTVRVRRKIKGATSPWTYLSETYPNGERVLYQSNATHVFKFIDTGNEITAIDSLRIDFDQLTSFGWNMLLGKDKIWYTYDPKYDADGSQSTKLYKLTDADTSDPYSDIIAVDTFDFLGTSTSTACSPTRRGPTPCTAAAKKATATNTSTASTGPPAR